jgi:hypothetical protein
MMVILLNVKKSIYWPSDERQQACKCKACLSESHFLSINLWKIVTVEAFMDISVNRNIAKEIQCPRRTIPSRNILNSAEKGKSPNSIIL